MQQLGHGIDLAAQFVLGVVHGFDFFCQAALFRHHRHLPRVIKDAPGSGEHVGKRIGVRLPQIR